MQLSTSTAQSTSQWNHRTWIPPTTCELNVKMSNVGTEQRRWTKTCSSNCSLSWALGFTYLRGALLLLFVLSYEQCGLIVLAEWFSWICTNLLSIGNLLWCPRNSKSFQKTRAIAQIRDAQKKATQNKAKRKENQCQGNSLVCQKEQRETDGYWILLTTTN